MSDATTLTEIATLAAGAIGRDLVPVKSVTKTVATKTVATVKAVAPKAKPTPAAFTMYDAVTVAHIPASATAVAGYVDGHYITVPELKKRFPRAKILTISVSASNLDAEFLDVENGDATPEQAVAWVKAKIERGDYKPGVYANRSTMPKVWALLAAAGIKRDQVRLWVGDWTGEAHIPASYDACQWKGGVTAAYDESLCAPGFLR